MLRQVDTSCPRRLKRAFASFAKLLESSAGRRIIEQRFALSVSIAKNGSYTEREFQSAFYPILMAINIQFYGLEGTLYDWLSLLAIVCLEAERICNTTKVYGTLNRIKHIATDNIRLISPRSYQSIIEDLRETSDPLRPWHYQLCTEFGWGTTTGLGNGAFGDVLRVE